MTLGTLGVALGLAQVWTAGINVSGVPFSLQTTLGSGKLFGRSRRARDPGCGRRRGALGDALAERYGLRTYAIGSSLDAATRAGINVRFHMLTLYALMGLSPGSWA